jgi:hypothetical protein
MVALPEAVRDAMLVEAAAEVKANQNAAWRLVLAHLLVSMVGTFFGTSIALWYWLFSN